jgi:hypothetical protein
MWTCNNAKADAKAIDTAASLAQSAVPLLVASAVPAIPRVQHLNPKP